MSSKRTAPQSVDTTAHIGPPCVLVIFGAAGDLTKRKLIPALYNLKKSNLLPDNFAVIGVARAEMNDDEFRKRLTDDLRDFATDDIDQEHWEWLEERLYYLLGDFNDDQTFVRLKELLEKAGALRDMVPNHLLQLVTLTAMEPPVSFKADAVRDEQTKILHAIQCPSPEEAGRRVVRGQYDAGMIDGQPAPAYRSEPNVAPDSNVETFVALKLLIDNWRWADVPFYLRTGKRLAARDTEITIKFRRAPFVLFRDTPVDRLSSNRLVLHIQPDEGISLRFGAKVPGPTVSIGAVDMDFDYEDYFGDTPSTGYERLLHDCMVGDATLFQRADQVEAGWSVVAPIQKAWKASSPPDFPNYKAGSWGPKEADELLRSGGAEWEETQDVRQNRLR